MKRLTLFALALLNESMPEVEVTSADDLKDKRIRAAVVAAPALGFAFGEEGLRDLRTPIRLWRAEDGTLLPHPWYAEAVRRALPLAPEYHVVPKAGHYGFMPSCTNVWRL